ncbi:MAG: U32 family peptidase, partial [Ruminococcaceae bacterium]|nr:U32 family peptidase [Oscillospiraceae bacterium]
GSTAFNARMKAKNFDENDLRAGIELAHEYGVKVYVAANTLILDREIDEYLRAAERAYLLSADAMIIADIGAASEVKKRIPIELHASTQVSGHNVDAAKRLCEAGFSRMVLAREMPKEDIAYFCKESPIESEVFVHGALCVCHSGQCLFSSIIGGRSGNRGECAQPCRLPYKAKSKKDESYPLSLKDLSLAEHITELCDMGVDSFKIEGRMKSPEYVRDVTARWRELIDTAKNADKRDMEYLASVFSRGGHTDAYFTRKIDSKMLGVRSDADKKESANLKPFEKITRKMPLELFASIKRGEPSSLTAKVYEKVVTVSGNTPEDARTAPISEETLRRNLSKLGDTAYTLKSLKIELDDCLMMPISAINALRRSAISALCEKCERTENDFAQGAKSFPIKKRKNQRSATFFEPKNIPSDAKDFFDYVYIPLEKYSNFADTGYGVMLPEVIFDSERENIEKMLEFAYKNGARDALIGNIGHIELVKAHGFTAHGDFRFNVFNNSSAAYLEKLGIEDFILSPELTLPQIRDIGGNSSVCVYGRLPLMITEKCVARELKACESCENGYAKLIDRRGVEFPILKRYEHRSAIFNSLPTYMLDRRADLNSARIISEHFIFTVESKTEIASIISSYQHSRQPVGACRRIK